MAKFHHSRNCQAKLIQQLTVGCRIAFSIAEVSKRNKRGLMLKIKRAANGEVVFTLSGRMDAENVAELKTVFGSEPKGRRIALDLKDLTLVDREAVRFLESCETDSIKIKNCPAYIREWITRERAGSGD
jgi:hypothetical protein